MSDAGPGGNMGGMGKDVLIPGEMKTSMKTTKILFGTLTVILALAAQAQAQNFLTNGLVMYLPFNGNANDASGNGNNGVVSGATLTTNRFGIANSAYSFDGVSAQIQVADVPQFDTGSHTISMWFNAHTWISTGPPSYVDLISKVNSGVNQGEWIIQGKQSGQIRNGVTTSVGNQYFDSISTLKTNQWHQVTAVWDGTTNWTYIDGVLDSSLPTTGTIQDESAPVRIGADYVSGQYFWGSLDDIRFYNRALSSNEVQQMHTIEAAGACQPHTAQATATLSYGFVVNATVTDLGCGYTNTPQVVIEGGGGTGATATATVNNGFVVAINITNPGSGYSSAPTIVIYPPNQNWQVGLLDEVVPTFSGLSSGSAYQLQVSSSLTTWTNQGAPFTATNSIMVYPQGYTVSNWNQLYFRLLLAP
jgi:hypothetical protein